MIGEKLIGTYVIIRTYSAGVFYGKLEAKEDMEVEVSDVRRIWYWSGAASLSQLAQEGTSDPKNCKFPMKEQFKVLTQVIEILPLTDQAKKSLDKVKIWEE